MPLLTALVNVLGRLMIVVVQLAAQALFGLAKTLGAATAALWRERPHPPRPSHRSRDRRRRARKVRRA